VACEKGHDVKVYLVDDAIHWAQFGMAEGVKASTGEEMKLFIDYLMEHGATIYVMFLGIIQPAAIIWHISNEAFDVAKHGEKAWRIFKESMETA